MMHASIFKKGPDVLVMLYMSPLLKLQHIIARQGNYKGI